MIGWAAFAAPVLCATGYAVKPTARAAKVAVFALGAYGVWVTAAYAWSLLELRALLGGAPADKATFLAAAISEGLNCAALLVLVALLWAVPMFIGRRRKLARRD